MVLFDRIAAENDAYSEQANDHHLHYSLARGLLKAKFLGKEAFFPEGPFYLALRMNAPVSFAFAMKEGPLHYHFYATPPKIYDLPKGKRISEENLLPVLKDYIAALEAILEKYPEQWFNYYQFWEEEKSSVVSL